MTKNFKTMSDLERIGFLEDCLGSKLEQVDPQEMEDEIFYHPIGQKYCLDTNNFLTGLALNELPIEQLHGNFFNHFLNLKFLRLRECTNGFIPDLIYIKELTSLDLSSNQLTDISLLKEIKGLTTLSLSGNRLTDISPLKELKRLTTLDLSSNQLIDISPLKELKRLTTLNLSSNQLVDISPLKELKNLYVIQLHSNQLTDVSDIKYLKKLKILGLTKNKIKTIPSWLAKMGLALKLSGSLGIGQILVNDNPIEEPPLEIVTAGNLTTMNNWNKE